MPNPDPERKQPFGGEAPEEAPVVEDREELPGQPPRREGSPLVEPDREPGIPEPIPPGPGSPS